MCSHLDCWQAETSDGRQWCVHDECLQVPGHSAWRELEAVCRRDYLTVLWAQVNTPTAYMRLDAEGCPLVCGELLTQQLSLTGGGATHQRYRWVMRQETKRRLWGIVGIEGAWQFESPPDGALQCPDPQAEGQ